jgi:hypothetical protein
MTDKQMEIFEGVFAEADKLQGDERKKYLESKLGPRWPMLEMTMKEYIKIQKNAK